MKDSTRIPVSNFTISEHYNISNFLIRITNVVLHTSATINVVFFEDYDRPVKSNTFILSGDDYKSWGNDDEYIVNWIKSKMNIAVTSNSGNVVAPDNENAIVSTNETVVAADNGNATVSTDETVVATADNGNATVSTDETLVATADNGNATVSTDETVVATADNGNATVSTNETVVAAADNGNAVSDPIH